MHLFMYLFVCLACFHFHYYYIVFIIISVQHVRMISEEPCDTEDWSNDIKLNFKLYQKRTFLNITFVSLYLFSNKCSPVSIRGLIKKH